jgi:hypothetical protein
MQPDLGNSRPLINYYSSRRTIYNANRSAPAWAIWPGWGLAAMIACSMVTTTAAPAGAVVLP